MINIISKLLLVCLLSTISFTNASANLAQAQDDNITNNLIGLDEINRIEDVAEKIAKNSEAEFKAIYDYLPSELSEEQKQRSLEIYDEALRRIDSGEIFDRKQRLSDGVFTDQIHVEGGEFGVAWIKGEPIISVSVAKHRNISIFKSELVDVNTKDWKRLLYDIHVFAGNSGFGITDIIENKEGDSKLRKFRNFLKKTYKGIAVRGAGINILTTDKGSGVVESIFSKRPKWFSLKWWKEYVGAIFLNRRVTLKGTLMGVALGAPAVALNYAFASPEAAVVMGVFLVSTQALYDSYFNFKTKSSPFKQIVKLSGVILGINLAIMQLTHGHITWELLNDSLLNMALSVNITYRHTYAKSIQKLSGRTRGDHELTPKADIKLTGRTVGKKIVILGKEYTVPEKFTIKSLTVDKAKVHDTMSDIGPSVLARMALVGGFSPAWLLAVALGGDVYALYRYKKHNMKDLNNPEIERIMSKLFYKPVFKEAIKQIKAVAKKLTPSCNNFLTKN